jgi:hypothetical protein
MKCHIKDSKCPAPTFVSDHSMGKPMTCPPSSSFRRTASLLFARFSIDTRTSILRRAARTCRDIRSQCACSNVPMYTFTALAGPLSRWLQALAVWPLGLTISVLHMGQEVRCGLWKSLKVYDLLTIVLVFVENLDPASEFSENQAANL